MGAVRTFAVLLLATLALAPASSASPGEWGQDPCAATQEKAVRADPELRERLGAGYGGIWIERETCRFGVGIAPATDRGLAQRIVTEHGAADVADLHDVRWTYAELLAGSDELAGRIGGLGWQVSSGIGLEGHELVLVLMLCDCATPEQQARAEQAAEANSIRPIIRREPMSPAGPAVRTAPGGAVMDAPRRIGRRTLLRRGVALIVHGRPGVAVVAELAGGGRRLALARAAVGADGTVRIALRPTRAPRRLRLTVTAGGARVPGPRTIAVTRG